MASTNEAFAFHAMLVLSLLTLFVACGVLAHAMLRVMDRLDPSTTAASPLPSPAAAPDEDEDDDLALWTDDVLAEREQREHPGSLGADPWLVDTFELEEGERQHADEARRRAARDARRPPD